MTDRFDFEQSFLNCWGVTEDVYKAAKLCEAIEDPKLQDEISNVLLGIRAVYDMRFQEAFDQFEEIVREQEI